MLIRIRIGFCLAAVLLFLSSTAALAKGNFAFVIVSSPGMDAKVLVTDPAVTGNFFAFADLSHGRTTEPVNPGQVYVITRYYIDEGRTQSFDRLHYYPDTGYVYYDGIIFNGWSDYDRKWYKANPAIKRAFEKDVQIAMLRERQRRAPFIRKR